MLVIDWGARVLENNIYIFFILFFLFQKQKQRTAEQPVRQSKILELGVLDLLEHLWIGEGFMLNISTYHRGQQSRRTIEIFKNVCYSTKDFCVSNKMYCTYR